MRYCMFPNHPKLTHEEWLKLEKVKRKWGHLFFQPASRREDLMRVKREMVTEDLPVPVRRWSF